MFRWVLIVILLQSTFLSAQSKRLMHYNMQQAQHQKDWNKAIFWAKAYLKKDSLNPHVRYHLACYLFQINELKKAQIQFKRVLQMAPQINEAYYQLAHVYKMQTKFEDARKAWNMYIKESAKDSTALFSDPASYWGSQKGKAYFRNRSRIEIHSLQIHHDTLWTKHTLQAVPIYTRINSPESEMPVNITDSSQWNFVRWQAHYDNEKRYDIPKLYNVLGYNDKITVMPFSDSTYASPDTVAYWNSVSDVKFEIMECYNQHHHQIKIRTIHDTLWKSLWNYKIENSENAHPAFAKINDTIILFFSSNRPGGYGSWDIWYSALTNAGKVIYTRNAGSQINTSENELCPYFDPLCKRLYFSSTGHPGLGGYDIFFTTLSANKFQHFKSIEHAGVPLNSAFHDLHFKTSTDSRFILLSSNRSPGLKSGNCCMDIYMYKVDSVELKKPIDTTGKNTSVVISLKQQLQLQAPLALYFENNQPNLGTAVKSYSNYYNTYCKQAAAYKQRFINDADMYKQVQAFFTDALPKSYADVMEFKTRIRSGLNKNVDIYLGVRAFASPLADKSYNLDLSKRRIESLRLFITEGLPQDKTQFLHIIELPFGERENSEVSDSYRDLKNSVYSINAIRERVVVIEHIQVQK